MKPRKDHTGEFPALTKHHLDPASRNEWRFIILLSMMVMALIGYAIVVDEAEASPIYEPTWASYYTLWGNRTSCGKTASPNAWFVASLQRDTASCGKRVTICRRLRCVKVTVQDRGAWRSDGRRWDLQVRVKYALRCSDLCRVSWKHGW